jgi:hypothetical protein
MQLDRPQIEPRLPITIENIGLLLKKAIQMGRVQMTEHFKQRSAERKFTNVEAEKIVRDGELIGVPEYCPKFKNWRCCLVGISCSRVLEIRVGLSFELDLHAPVLVLITGIPKGRVSCKKTKSPRPTLRL